MIYNSALKNNTQYLRGYPITNRFVINDNIGFRRNLVVEGYHENFDLSDCFYCEPPYPSGLKIFDERSGERTKSYSDFCTQFANFWDVVGDRPKFAVASKQLLKSLSKPDFQVQMRLNANIETLSCWNAEAPNNLTSNQVCYYLGTKYNCLGDPTCGYGNSVISFIKARKTNTFVASDYDGRCISVLKMRLENEDLS